MGESGLFTCLLLFPDAAAACGEHSRSRKNFYLPRIEHRVSRIEIIFRLTFL